MSRQAFCSPEVAGGVRCRYVRFRMPQIDDQDQDADHERETEQARQRLRGKTIVPRFDRPTVSRCPRLIHEQLPGKAENVPASADPVKMCDPSPPPAMDMATTYRLYSSGRSHASRGSDDSPIPSAPTRQEVE